MHAFMTAAPGSREFNTRLVELVTRAIHQIAVNLSKSEPGFHKDNDFTTWMPSKTDGHGDDRLGAILLENYQSMMPLKTLFVHRWYTNYDGCPDGVHGGVGYWAEARIMGGVVLFDGRDPAKIPDANVRDGPLCSRVPPPLPPPLRSTPSL